MGQPMASRLVAAGHEVVVYDPRDSAVTAMTEAGAQAALSVADLADRTDVVFLSLPMPEVVRAVALGADGVVAGGRAKVVVDLSTTGSRVEEEVATALAEAGKTLVDCPISGGVGGARKGTLALMAAGDAVALAGLEDVLSVFGKVYVVGDRPGQGQTMKVINNLMSTAALTIASETLVLGAKAGLDPDVMLDVINAGSGASNATATKIPQFVLSRTFDFGFAIGLSAKDARLCLEEGDRLGVPMVVGTAVRTMLNITRDTLGADADMTSVIKVVEGWAGVDVKGKAAR